MSVAGELGITNANITIFILKVVLTGGMWYVAKTIELHGQKVILKNKRIMDTLKHMGVSERKVQAVDAVLDISVYIVAAIFTLYIFNLTSIIYTILTAAGVIGVVIGFGVQEIVSNAVSGVILKINQSFKVGHYISVNGNQSGTVRKIRTYSTELVGSDGVRTILPNSKLLTSTITNYSVEPKRRIEVTINVAPGTDIKKALKVLEKIAENEKRRVKDSTLEAYVERIGDYFISLQLRFWTKRADYWETKQDTMLSIADAFKKKKMKLAVPLRRNITDSYD